MKLSDFLVQELYRLTGTDKIFGYIGGMIAHIVDSIYQDKSVEMVNMITEQGAGFAAEGYARTTGKTGIAIATSGPGATNLVTPIANCFFDSTPVLFITGNVNTYEYKTFDVRQCGFQETNIIDIVKPVVKYAKRIINPEDIRYELQKAISIAQSGRKGPVLLDIPMDIQRAEIDVNSLKRYTSPFINYSNKFDISLLEKAKKPLILVGNGVNISNAKQELSLFLQKNNIPVVESLLGIDCVLHDYKYNLGLIGTYGNRFGNIALYKSDLLLVIGARLDIRQTGGNLDFMKDKKIIQIDIDEKELNCSKFKKEVVCSDAKNFVEFLNSQEFNLDIEDWKNECINLKEAFSNDKKLYKMPNLILSKIFDNLKEHDVIVTDVGQNQVWAAQSAKIKKGQRMFSSGGHGCMGFALPAGIGAALSGKRAIVISGDGGFQMNIQELEIIKRRAIPIKIIVLNNKNLGMVRTFQELYFNGRCASTVEDYSVPNLENVAKAYGIDSVSLNADNFDVDKLIFCLNSNSAVLINIEFELETQVEPRLQFGNPINKQHPLLRNNEEFE